MTDADTHAAANDLHDEPSTEISARDRIRAFEDEHLGPDAVRINGEVERGHGSAFKALSPALHRHYAALERLVAAEIALGEAAAVHSQAQVAYDTAAAVADDSAVVAEEPQPQREPAEEN